MLDILIINLRGLKTCPNSKTHRAQPTIILYYIEDVARTIFNAINIQVFNLGDESELDYQLRFLVEFEKGLTK